MKRTTHIDVWWTIEWASWGIAIGAGLYAWFNGLSWRQLPGLILWIFLSWAVWLVFTLICAKAAQSVGSPRMAVGAILNAWKEKRKQR